jgi:hypothetical protein
MNHHQWIRSGVVALVATACSTNQSPSSSRGGAERDASTKDVSAPSSGTPEAPSLFGADAQVSRNGADGSAICAGQVSEAEHVELDMLIAMDGSGSMKDAVDGGAPKWDLVVAALDAFVNDQKSAGIGAGLTYFGAPDGYDAGDLVVSCDPADYARSAVGVDVLPRNAAAIASSLSAYVPQGGTPTRPALEGVVQQAHAWGSLHPSHRLIIVLATDGEPNDCDSTVEAVASIAATVVRETPSIATYVIGVGSNLSSLDQIAGAGGTGRAYVVDTGQGTTASFLAALNAIRGEAALPCTYQLPPATALKKLDYERVNVDYTPGATGSTMPLLQVPDRASCAAAINGWYYDNPRMPTSIALCPTSCTTVQSDPAGRIQVRVGCKTEKRIF